MNTLINLIIAVFFGLFGATIVAKPMNSFTDIHYDQINGIAIFIAIVSFLIAYTYLNNRNVLASTAASLISFSDEIHAKIESSNATYLAVAEKEANEGRADDALWSQALFNAKGDESQRKYQYMKLRSRQLKKGLA